MIIEGKYPNSFYNNFLIPLAVDNMSLHQNTAKLLLGLFSLSLTYFLRHQSVTSKVPLLLFIALPWIQKKLTKRDGVLLTALNFRKKIASPDKRKHIAEVSNFSVTSCLLKAPFMKCNMGSTGHQSTKTTQWTVDRLADQINSDQSNQSPSQKVSNQTTCKKVS